MVGKIYLSLEKQFPNDDEAIMESAFKQFIQDVLLQIEMDISDKLRKLEAKHPGQLPCQLKDATAVYYNDDEQEANLQLRRSMEQRRDEEDRRRQLNVTYDEGPRQPFPGVQTYVPSLGRPPPTGDSRFGASVPPQTLAPHSLSAAQLQAHQNSFNNQNNSMQEAALQRLREPQPMSPQMPYGSLPAQKPSGVGPPTSPNPMLTSPSMSQPPSQLGRQAPGTTAPPLTVSQPMYQGFTQEEVESMKLHITSATDGLKVQVYNQHLQLEPKRLSLNKQLCKIGIFDVVEGGLGYPTAFFDIPDLKCITQGISQSIMESPPPPEVSLGFRFSQESLDTKDRSQDKFLCFVFDSPEKCRLAGEAFSQLCGVPVAPALS
jgi:hypothetical protein